MKNIILFILLFSISLFAIERDEIVPVMTKKIDQATTILKEQKDLPTKVKADKIFNILDEVFDYKLMAKLSLGKSNWKSMNKEQREEFTKKFITHLKKSFMDKINLYTDEKIKILELKEPKKNILWLVTELMKDKDKYEIVYKFHKSKKSSWKIYDVNILGVSLIKTYRVQFANALKDGTYTALLNKLQ
jgi:phospholipid transport system substrate-binding protein